MKKMQIYNKIFISHSEKDKELVKMLEELLMLGIGFTREQIFCTSDPGCLETGRAYSDEIKNEMKEAKLVIAVITDNYLNSKSCVMELGAGWLLSDQKEFFPMLVSPVTFLQVENSLLKGYQLSCMDRNGLAGLYDLCMERNLVENKNTAEFIERVDEFLKKTKSVYNMVK